MRKIICFILLNFFITGSAVADSIITVKPEFSLHYDGRALIVNAQQFCPDATYIYIDTTTAVGKAMYTTALLANALDKQLHFQTGCTCNSNCSNSGEIPVFKICSELRDTLCE